MLQEPPSIQPKWRHGGHESHEDHPSKRPLGNAIPNLGTQKAKKIYIPTTRPIAVDVPDSKLYPAIESLGKPSGRVGTWRPWELPSVFDAVNDKADRLRYTTSITTWLSHAPRLSVATKSSQERNMTGPAITSSPLFLDGLSHTRCCFPPLSIPSEKQRSRSLISGTN